MHMLVVVPQMESKSMSRRHIVSLLDCVQCNGKVYDSIIQ